MKNLLSKTTLALGAMGFVLASTTGCANMSETQKGTAIGAAVGAVAGVAVGNKDKKGKNAAIGAGVGALGGYIWSQQMEKKKKEMEAATEGTGISVSQTADNQLKVNIPSDFSFDTSSYAIKANMEPVLNQFANGLGANANTVVRIVGHTDNTGTLKINQPLSENRAMSVRNYLMNRGMNGAQITTTGVADSQPVSSNATVEGRAQNRRVEIFLAEKAS